MAQRRVGGGEGGPVGGLDLVNLRVEGGQVHRLVGGKTRRAHQPWREIGKGDGFAQSFAKAAGHGLFFAGARGDFGEQLAHAGGLPGDGFTRQDLGGLVALGGISAEGRQKERPFRRRHAAWQGELAAPGFGGFEIATAHGIGHLNGDGLLEFAANRADAGAGIIRRIDLPLERGGECRIESRSQRFGQLQRGERRVGICTDLGHVFDDLRSLVASVDGLYLESNYDEGMLERGRYPYVLKKRIRGPGGHIANREAAELVARHATSRLQWLCLAHLSEENNTPELARTALSAALGWDAAAIHVADAGSGSEWLTA